MSIKKNQTVVTAEPGKQEVFITREFDAPRELVFKAHIDPNGNQFGFHGVFHEISEERMIQTFEFEGLPEGGHVTLDTMRLESLPGNRTRVTIQSLFQSVADRDGMVQSGMERGVNEGYERLDEVLAKM